MDERQDYKDQTIILRAFLDHETWKNPCLCIENFLSLDDDA